MFIEQDISEKYSQPANRYRSLNEQMNSNNQRFYRINSLVTLNETESGSSLFPIAEVLETTSKHIIVQMYSSPDILLFGEEQRREKLFHVKVSIC